MSDHRLTELEIKVSFQESMLAELDGVLRLVRDRLDRQERELGELRAQLAAGTPEIVDEKPPHYQ